MRGCLAGAGVAAMLLAGPAHARTTDPGVTLRQAREYWEAGKQKKALKRLNTLRNGELADHVELLRARWLREQGKPEAALEAARAALSHSPSAELRARIQHEQARGRLEQGDLLHAYRAQRDAWESTGDADYSASLMAEFAGEFQRRGLPGDALHLYRRVWQRWPLAEPSGEAFDRSQQLRLATGADAVSPQQLLARADALREAFRCGEVLESYESLLAHPQLEPALALEARRGQADCLFQMRRYGEAVAAYQRLVELDPQDYAVAIQRARAEGRAGHTTRAVRTLEAIAQKAPAAERAQAQYLLALLLEDSGAQRSRKLLQGIERQRDAPELSRRARWRLAWSEIGEGHNEEAIRRLAPLTRGSRWDIEVQRARYWSAVTRSRLDREQGRAELEELAHALPLSYYGLIAADQLGAAPRIEHSFVGAREGQSLHPRAQRATWLIEGQFPAAGLIELESWIRNERLDRDERLVAARLLHGMKEHFHAVRLIVDGFGGTLDQGIDPEWREAWQLAWPRAFDASVHQAVKEFGSDPALLFAVMREESTYRPRVESPAGALGLMQIIPPTGSRIAQTLGLTSFRPENLLIPETNIRFGAYYLKSLLKRFEGAPSLAIAAYNAGPEAVVQWRSRGNSPTQDAFVESVPYGETRRYLRRVLRSYRIYQLLYGKQPTSTSAPQS